MQKATFVLDLAFRVGEVDPRLFGGFLEHLGRAIYGGIYDPGHPTADEQRISWRCAGAGQRARRADRSLPRRQLRLRVQLGRWRRPQDERPRRLDLAWMSTESNEFGTNEFSAWADAADVEVMMAVNLGTRGVDAARNLVEYCNHPGRNLLERPARSNMASPNRTGSGSGAWATRWMVPGRSVPKPPWNMGVWP